MPDFTAADLSVVIPTRGRWPILRRTVDGLAKQSVRGFETLVVVDGEDQQPPKLDGIRLIIAPQRGPGAARNTGVRSVNRPLVLFLGDDMIPDAHLVEHHIHRHSREPEPSVAVLGHVDLHPQTKSNRLNRWMDWSGTQFDYHHIAGDDAGFGRFYSCNVSLKRDFFLDAGGFDENFVFYYEDLDCGWRLHQKGMRLRYERSAVVRHLHPLQWDDVVRRFQGIARGERMMDAKHAWFEPHFAKRVKQALRARRVGGVWTVIADRVPTRLSKLRSWAERRGDTRYYQRVGPYFVDAWDATKDLEELRDYLGDRYDESRLMDHMHQVQRELAEVGDEETFYRSSEAYLYDLTVFAMSGTKAPYRRDLQRLVGRRARLLDWGCGIGADGLRLLEQGYAVTFADFDNPSTRFLRWRLERRGLSAEVYDLDNGDVPGGFDAAFAFDVIEHVADPFAFLAELERRAPIVMVNLLEDEPDPLHPHRSLPITALLDHATRRGLLAYRLYYGRSHLVAYRGDGASPRIANRLRSTVVRRFGPRIGALRDG